MIRIESIVMQSGGVDVDVTLDGATTDLIEELSAGCAEALYAMAHSHPGEDDICESLASVVCSMIRGRLHERCCADGSAEAAH